MSRLRRINVSPLNQNFVFKDKIYLNVGKTDENEDEYDILLCARRGIREISISSNIKIIAINAFDHCCNLKKVEIPVNSNLHIIESNAFSYSKIEEIYFPASLKELKKYCFRYTSNLTNFKISPLNKKNHLQRLQIFTLKN